MWRRRSNERKCFSETPSVYKKKKGGLSSGIAWPSLRQALFSFTFPSHSHTTAQCFQLLKTIFSHCYLCQTCAAHVHGLFFLNNCSDLWLFSGSLKAFCCSKLINKRHCSIINCPPCMLPLQNGPTSMTKCLQLCIVMPMATNSLLTITSKGGCVRVCLSLHLNLGKSVGLFPFYTSLHVQIHTDTPVAGTMLQRYLKIHPGFKERQALKEMEIIALRSLFDGFVPWMTFSFWR